MKRSIWMSLAVIAVAATLIAGATTAWFTDENVASDAEFSAGTVEIAADEVEFLAPSTHENWAPGDTTQVSWAIVNTSSLDIKVRVQLSGSWSDGLATNNVSFTTPADWTLNADGWYYLTAPLVGGADVTFTTNVTLDRTTDNSYQGKSYTLGGTVQAIQDRNAAWTDYPTP